LIVLVEHRVRRGIRVRSTHGDVRRRWWEVIWTFLSIGALSYGGLASMGIMQTEVQEKRAWLPKEQFIEGLALLNTLPGPHGVQLGIFLGFTRAGWWGGVLLGIVPTLLLAGAAGVMLYGSRTWGLISALVIVALYAAHSWGSTWLTMPAFTATDRDAPMASLNPGLWDVGFFFLKVGAFSFGGGLTILAFMQEQVVDQLQWLTPQQFLDGLTLGRLTPGHTLMLAAFVGYAVGSIWGAVVAAAIYLPSFILMLSLLPLLESVKRLAWMQAALQGISPAVIGMTAVAVLQMLPYAIPDLLTGALAVGTVVMMGLWRLSPLPLMAGGSAVGLILRAR
jgi:chromate transporter